MKDESVSRGEVSLSRASVLKGASGVMAGLFLAGVGGLGGIVGAPAAARAEQEQQQEDREGVLEEYASPDGSFALRYPVGFKGFSKPLKTHKIEVSFEKQRRLSQPVLRGQQSSTAFTTDLALLSALRSVSFLQCCLVSLLRSP